MLVLGEKGAEASGNLILQETCLMFNFWYKLVGFDVLFFFFT